MTISASDDAAAGFWLGCTQKLYRDLSVALDVKIEQLKAGHGSKEDWKDCDEALKALQRTQQSLIEAEARLVKRTDARGAGAGVELDLDAARAEVVARLAVWAGES